MAGMEVCSHISLLQIRLKTPRLDIRLLHITIIEQKTKLLQACLFWPTSPDHIKADELVADCLKMYCHLSKVLHYAMLDITKWPIILLKSSGQAAVLNKHFKGVNANNPELEKNTYLLLVGDCYHRVTHFGEAAVYMVCFSASPLHAGAPPPSAGAVLPAEPAWLSPAATCPSLQLLGCRLSEVPSELQCLMLHRQTGGLPVPLPALVEISGLPSQHWMLSRGS